MSKFALGSNPENPLRCSKLGEFMKCTMKLYLMSELLENLDDEGGIAAQTGSLTHEGVAAFHKTQDRPTEERKRAAWQAIADNAARFPLAEENEVRLFITPYMDDPRNIKANCIAVEEEIRFTLPPHELDETGLPIHIKGTLDQLRLENGRAYVYDLKTGKPTGLMMIHDYAIQLAAYVYGVRQVGKGSPSSYILRDNKPVLISEIENGKYWANAEPGKIIRNHGYRTRENKGVSPDGVFWTIPFGVRELEDLIDGVRFAVAMFRNGNVFYGPGQWCSYCNFGGLIECTNKYQQLKVRNR